jgi:quercetin dioxygenase-like cupin family protein
MSGFVLGEDEGLNINFHGTKMIIKVSEKDSEGRYSLIVNSGPALHIHPNSPEANYVLDGEYTVQFGENIRHAYAGDFVFIPKGSPHKYKSGPNGGKLIVIAHADLEKYFKEVYHTIRLNGQITWKSEQEIAACYGQEFLDSLNHWG